MGTPNELASNQFSQQPNQKPVEFVYQAVGEQATQQLGKALALCLLPGSVVGLDGPLGAGKTRLVQAIAAAAGVPPDEVTSPTFVLIHEYPAKIPIYHFDAYRIRDEDEFWELGVDEYFAGSGWCLIEWAERVINCLPKDRLQITIEPTGEDSRRFVIVGLGRTATSVVESLATTSISSNSPTGG